MQMRHRAIRRQIFFSRLPRAMSSSSTAFQWRHGTEDALAQSVRSFNAFLRQAKSDLHDIVDKDSSANNGKVVHVMIGNEAADADSIVSSLVYANFKHHAKAFAAQDHVEVYVPVLPIPREELVLRCDVSSLFSKLEIDLDAILFVNEFPWQHAAFEKGKNAQLKITLLDHNALNPKRMIPPTQQQQQSEIGQVVEILDHHMDLGKHPAASVREIAFADGQALVASNCTLIAEKIIAFNAEHGGRNDEVFALSSTLLLAVIALDSVNFNPSAKKVTARDIEAAKELEKAAFASKEALFEWLQAEKFNPAHWAKFSVRNCLMCDYKEFGDASSTGLYGVSSILIDLDKFVNKADSSAQLTEQLQAFAQENHLAFLLVMTMFVDTDGARRRQLLFYEPSGNNNDITAKCVRFLEQEGSLQLERVDLPASHADARLQAFNQRNAGASRKQVVPLLQLALSGKGSGENSKY